jgi:hypothetical protein
MADTDFNAEPQRSQRPQRKYGFQFRGLELPGMVGIGLDVWKGADDEDEHEP